MPTPQPAPLNWSRRGYGFVQAPARPDGSGYVQSMYNPAPRSDKSPDSPILCAVYIPPGHAREPDKAILNASVFGPNSDPQNVVTLHVSYGPLVVPQSYDDRRALYMPGIFTSVFGAGYTAKEVVVDTSPLDATGQTLVSVHGVPLYSESDNHNTRNPYTVDLNGHPGDPDTDGLLVVAQAGAGCVISLSLTPMPKSRQRARQAMCGIPRTRDDVLGGFIR